MKFILPRFIVGNRGDLASRWGVLHALHILGVKDVTVFSSAKEDLPDLPFLSLSYRPLKNLLQDRTGLQAFRKSDVVLWAVGLDLQDDSSLARLAYLAVVFRIYRILGLRIWILFQGAGPLTTPAGRWLARTVLKSTDVFIARDPGTYELIGKIHPAVKRILAHDAIFLPGFEQDFQTGEKNQWLDELFASDGRPVIGLNVRQWFHFSSSILPYQLARGAYLKRSEAKMQGIIDSAVTLVRLLRQRFDARVLLISAYQPGTVPWEDDQPWLSGIKDRLGEDAEVILTDRPVTLNDYYSMMSRLSLMIGMRLHSSLIALRFGVPSLNINYTLKGGDIMRHLGFGENVMELGSFIDDPKIIFERVERILDNLHDERERTIASIQNAIEMNMEALRSLIGINGK